MIEIPAQTDVQGIEPQTTVILCHGIPWDRSYNHVRLFSSNDELLNFIKTKAVYTNTTSAPVNRGSAIVNIALNELTAWACDYIAFQNMPYSEAWNYGFITAVEPLSVNSCRVSFVIDVWNMCQFNMTLNKTFVERCIVPKAEDVIGVNTVPEELETGDYVSANSKYAPESYEPNSYEVVIASSTDSDGNAVSGGLYGNVYTATQYRAFDITDGDTDQISDYVNAFVENGYQDNIINATMIPYGFVSETLQDRTITFSRPNSIDGYTPRNNKCFCYPYIFLEATNNTGTNVRYKYEFFLNPSEATFYYTINTDTQPCLVTYPQNYMGIEKNYQSSVYYNQFPQCTLAVDGFKAYLAQATNAGAVNKLADAFTSYTGINIGDTGRDALKAISGLSSFISSAVGVGGEGYTTSVNVDVNGALKATTQALGTADGTMGTSGGGINTSIGADRIFFYQKTVRAEYIKIIDDYFSMYGYKVNRLMTPNIHARTSWDFIKTIGIDIQGNFDAGLKNQINAIFNNGVTIWHTNDIGNYSLSND